MTGLPPAPASLPAVPQASSSGQYSAATVSSGPQPASMFGQPTPVMLPPLHYQGLDAAQPFGYQPAAPGSTATPPGMHPSRIAALAAGGAAPQVGTVRSADEMEGGEGQPPAKRQKIAKLPGGQYYPETDWINMHPVSYPASLCDPMASLNLHDSIQYHCRCNCPTIPRDRSGSSMARWLPSTTCRSTCSCLRCVSGSCNTPGVACLRRECGWHMLVRC